MGSDPFMTEVEAKTPPFFTSATVNRGSDPIKSSKPAEAAYGTEFDGDWSSPDCTDLQLRKRVLADIERFGVIEVFHAGDSRCMAHDGNLGMLRFPAQSTRHT